MITHPLLNSAVLDQPNVESLYCLPGEPAAGLGRRMAGPGPVVITRDWQGEIGAARPPGSAGGRGRPLSEPLCWQGGQRLSASGGGRVRDGSIFRKTIGRLK